MKIRLTPLVRKMTLEELSAERDRNWILKFIHRFTKRHDKTLSDVKRCFTDGCCWWFAHILCERFCGEMVYDEIDGHFAAEISGRVYDITGDVTETFRKTYWRGYRDGVKRAVENEEEHK